MSPLRWREDGRALTFEYNERGHGTYRIVGVDRNGEARAVVDEVTASFFYYRPSSGDGKVPIVSR